MAGYCFQPCVLSLFSFCHLCHCPSVDQIRAFDFCSFASNCLNLCSCLSSFVVLRSCISWFAAVWYLPCGFACNITACRTLELFSAQFAGGRKACRVLCVNLQKTRNPLPLQLRAPILSRLRRSKPRTASSNSFVQPAAFPCVQQVWLYYLYASLVIPIVGKPLIFVKVQVRSEGCAGHAYLVPHRTHGVGLACQHRARHFQFVSSRHLGNLVVTGELQSFWFPFVTQDAYSISSCPLQMARLYRYRCALYQSDTFDSLPAESSCRQMRDPRVVSGSTSKWIPKVFSRQLQCRTLFPSLLDGLVETLSMYIDSLEAHCVFSTQLFLAHGRRQHRRYRTVIVSLSLASVSLSRKPASDPKRPCSCMSFPHACAAEATSFSEGTSSVALLPASYPRKHKLPRPREFSHIVATCSCSHLAKQPQYHVVRKF